MIRVVVVDDSRTVRAKWVEILSRDPGIAVVGEATTGHDAIELCVALRPDVVTLDLVMPGLDGVAVTEQIMSRRPTPILIVSAASNRADAIHTYQALEAGAVDVLDKPHGDDESESAAWELRFLAAVRLVSRIKVITHPRARLAAAAGRPLRRTDQLATLDVPASGEPLSVVALGASTGGPGALAEVLGALPPRFSLPVIAVLHIDPAFAMSFADWLAARTGRTVRVAAEHDRVDGHAGEVLLAPPHRHLTVANGRVRLVQEPPRNHCRPSIDVLFESLAADRGARTIACLLTGMGRDGAEGLLAIRRAGGTTFAQDEASSVVYGMPREAVLRGAAERVLALHEIGPMIAGLVELRRTR